MILSYLIKEHPDTGSWSWTLYAEGNVLASGGDCPTRDAAVAKAKQAAANLGPQFKILQLGEIMTPPVPLERLLGVVSQGIFSGPVIGIVDGVLIQKTDREGKTERHDIRLLTRLPLVGEVIDVKYQYGVGVIPGKEIGIER